MTEQFYNVQFFVSEYPLLRTLEPSDCLSNTSPAVQTVMAKVDPDRLCKPEIRVAPPPLEEAVMSLEDFVTCYSLPQRAKVICGYWEASTDGCDDSSREFAADEIIHLAQVVCPFVNLLVDDPSSGRTIGISLSIGFQGARFRVVSHRESVGSKTPRVFKTVREMVTVFPHTVKALAGHRNAVDEEKMFNNGDRLRLVRVVSLPGGGKALECKLLRGNMRLLQLPIAYEGNFAEVDDPRGYSLHELVSIARVPRTLKICPNVASPSAIIPGIPANFNGCVTMERPQLLVHIERVQQQEDGNPDGAEADGKPFLVPVDCPIEISLREDTYQGSDFSSLTTKDLVKKYGASTPFVARVTDWFEETSVLHQHLVRPGHELVFIREETRSNILVREKPHKRHFLIPIDHNGSFFRLNHIREDCGVTRRTLLDLKSLEDASFPFDVVCTKDDNPYSNLPEDVLPMDMTLTFEAFVKEDPTVVVAKLADGIICKCFHLPTRTGLSLQFERRWHTAGQAEAFKQRWSDRDCLAEEISGTVYNEFMKIYSDYEWFPAEVSACVANK